MKTFVWLGVSAALFAAAGCAGNDYYDDDYAYREAREVCGANYNEAPPIRRSIDIDGDVDYEYEERARGAERYEIDRLYEARNQQAVSACKAYLRCVDEQGFGDKDCDAERYYWYEAARATR